MATVVKSFAQLFDPTQVSDFVSFLQNVENDPSIDGEITFPEFKDATGNLVQIAIQVSLNTNTNIFTVSSSQKHVIFLAGVEIEIDPFSFEIDTNGIIQTFNNLLGDLQNPVNQALSNIQLNISVDQNGNLYTITASNIPSIQIGELEVDFNQFSITFDKDGIVDVSFLVDGTIYIPGTPSTASELNFSLARNQNGSFTFQVTNGESFTIGGFTVLIRQFSITFDENGIQSNGIQFDGDIRFPSSPTNLTASLVRNANGSYTVTVNAIDPQNPPQVVLGDFSISLQSLSFSFDQSGILSSGFSISGDLVIPNAQVGLSISIQKSGANYELDLVNTGHPEINLGPFRVLFSSLNLVFNANGIVSVNGNASVKLPNENTGVSASFDQVGNDYRLLVQTTNPAGLDFGPFQLKINQLSLTFNPSGIVDLVGSADLIFPSSNTEIGVAFSKVGNSYRIQVSNNLNDINFGPFLIKPGNLTVDFNASGITNISGSGAMNWQGDTTDIGIQFSKVGNTYRIAVDPGNFSIPFGPVSLNPSNLIILFDQNGIIDINGSGTITMAGSQSSLSISFSKNGASYRIEITTPTQSIALGPFGFSISTLLIEFDNSGITNLSGNGSITFPNSNAPVSVTLSEDNGTYKLTVTANNVSIPFGPVTLNPNQLIISFDNTGILDISGSGSVSIAGSGGTVTISFSKNGQSYRIEITAPTQSIALGPFGFSISTLLIEFDNSGITNLSGNGSITFPNSNAPVSVSLSEDNGTYKLTVTANNVSIPFGPVTLNPNQLIISFDNTGILDISGSGTVSIAGSGGTVTISFSKNGQSYRIEITAPTQSIALGPFGFSISTLLIEFDNSGITNLSGDGSITFPNSNAPVSVSLSEDNGTYKLTVTANNVSIPFGPVTLNPNQLIISFDNTGILDISGSGTVSIAGSGGTVTISFSKNGQSYRIEITAPTQSIALGPFGFSISTLLIEFDNSGITNLSGNGSITFPNSNAPVSVSLSEDNGTYKLTVTANIVSIPFGPVTLNPNQLIISFDNTGILDISGSGSVSIAGSGGTVTINFSKNGQSYRIEITAPTQSIALGPFGFSISTLLIEFDNTGITNLSGNGSITFPNSNAPVSVSLSEDNGTYKLTVTANNVSIPFGPVTLNPNQLIISFDNTGILDISGSGTVSIAGSGGTVTISFSKNGQSYRIEITAPTQSIALGPFGFSISTLLIEFDNSGITNLSGNGSITFPNSNAPVSVALSEDNGTYKLTVTANNVSIPFGPVTLNPNQLIISFDNTGILDISGSGTVSIAGSGGTVTISFSKNGQSYRIEITAPTQSIALGPFGFSISTLLIEFDNSGITNLSGNGSITFPNSNAPVSVSLSEDNGTYKLTVTANIVSIPFGPVTLNPNQLIISFDNTGILDISGSGSVSIAGSGGTVTINFSKNGQSYRIEITAPTQSIALGPFGFSISTLLIEFDNTGITNLSGNGSITFPNSNAPVSVSLSEDNGTYKLTVTANNVSIPFGPVTLNPNQLIISFDNTGILDISGSGTVSIAGSGGTVTISFSKNGASYRIEITAPTQSIALGPFGFSISTLLIEFDNSGITNLSGNGSITFPNSNAPVSVSLSEDNGTYKLTVTANNVSIPFGPVTLNPNQLIISFDNTGILDISGSGTVSIAGSGGR